MASSEPGSPSRTLRSSAPAFSPASPRARQPCSFFRQGTCRFGDKCWFSHDITAPLGAGSPSQTSIDSTGPILEFDMRDDCSICFEQPSFYGLLEHCSHVFCSTCINRWRTIEGKSTEQILSGALSACPICRVPSTFVCLSPIFYAAGPEKQFTIAQMKEKLSQIECKHYKPASLTHRPCPFGSDCLYRHMRPDGALHQFEYTRQQYLETMHRPRTVEEDWLLDILMQAASGRDAADILRRITGRRGPVDRGSLSGFIQSLQQMGLGQDAGDEDEWVDEETESFLEGQESEEEEDFAESEGETGYHLDVGDEPPRSARPVRTLPRRREGASSTSTHASMPPLEPMDAGAEEEDEPSPHRLPAAHADRATRSRPVHRRVYVPGQPMGDESGSDDFDSMPPLEAIESDSDDSVGGAAVLYEDETGLSRMAGYDQSPEDLP